MEIESKLFNEIFFQFVYEHAISELNNIIKETYKQTTNTHSTEDQKPKRKTNHA